VSLWSGQEYAAANGGPEVPRVRISDDATAIVRRGQHAGERVLEREGVRSGDLDRGCQIFRVS
jgi:hypothetical protein